ncbi:MAG: hypothetical protein AAF683_02415 [Pseudomonadota bacterium]
MNPENTKALIRTLRQVLADGDWSEILPIFRGLIAHSVSVRLCHLFGMQNGADAYFASCLNPLQTDMPDLERRDMIVLAGETPEGSYWAGCIGNYIGTFVNPFLGIPPTGHLAHMRYHDFFQIEDRVVVEFQAIWDIPELMMQARAWPMAPPLGAHMCTPATMTGDGLTASVNGAATQAHVIAMLEGLYRQVGLDVLARINEFNKARNLGPISVPTGLG